MTIMEMLEQSGVLTLLGMGIVFGFLIIMIITITLVGKLIHALGMDTDVKTQAGAPKIAGAAAGTAAGGEITAAITAAVNQHRKG